MEIFFNIILHLIIISGIFFMIYYSVLIIKSANNDTEKFIRMLSLLTGFLLFLGSKAIGLSLPDTIFRSIVIPQLFSFSTVIQIIIPSCAGTFAAWFLLKFLKRKDRQDVAFRFFLILASLIFMLFAEVYIEVYKIDSISNQVINRNLLPNLTFVLALLLYTIFNYHKYTDDEEDRENDNWKNL